MNRALRALLAALLVSASLALGGARADPDGGLGRRAGRESALHLRRRQQQGRDGGLHRDGHRGDQGAPAERGSYFLHDVTVTQVYKGEIDTETVQVRSEKVRKECSLGELDPGVEYMFFVVSAGDPWIAASGGGTTVADAELVDKVVRLLGDGRDPVPPPPETAEFTPVDTDDPTTLSRAAAPGLALVLIGLLGLIVVRGLGRRRS